jgi:predicted nucleotidyltransferase
MIARIVEVLHPEQVWLFGSRERGEARVDSDWDFMTIVANDAPEQDLDLASMMYELRTRPRAISELRQYCWTTRASATARLVA